MYRSGSKTKIAMTKNHDILTSDMSHTLFVGAKTVIAVVASYTEARKGVADTTLTSVVRPYAVAAAAIVGYVNCGSGGTRTASMM